MRVHLAKDCHKDPKLISRHLTQLQTALQRLIRQRADSQHQQQQQQQGSCSLSSPISSSIQAFGTLTPMAMPRHQALQQLQQQLASPVMTTPVVQPWSHQQQQQHIGRKRQRQAEGVAHQLGYDDNDEEQQQQQQLQQQRQQRWKGLPDDTDASLDLDLDLDMAPSQLSQLSQVHLPFVYSQAEEQQ
jgi:hypothetical protein